MSEQSESLLTFPCQFPIKIFGQYTEQFGELIESIVHQHVSQEHVMEIRENAGKGKKFVAYTVTIHAQSQAQLDAIYRALTDEDAVVMAL